MKTLSRKESFPTSAQQVFKTIDDLGVTGLHMTESSMMMMGSKLNLEFLTTNKTGLGSRYRWTGKMMGLMMDFTVEVTKWISGVEKVWETIGDTKLIIYSWYRMKLLVNEVNGETEVELSISYEKPKDSSIRSCVSSLRTGIADGALRKCLVMQRRQLKIPMVSPR